MQGLIGAIVAAFAGIVLGFWLRAASNKVEKAQLESRARELTDELATARNDMSRTQAESASRAGFESLAAEREKTIAQLAAERDGLRADLQAKGAVENAQNARIKELEAELRNERQNLTEKLTLLESAKQTLANQFEALAGKILDEKSKSFSEGSQKELGTLLDPLKTQIKEFRDKVEQAQSDSKTGVARLEGLIGNLGSLNLQLAEEAKNLTTALRGSAKAQGDWGEFILRDLLEKAGLREGEQYSFQQSFTGLTPEDGEKSKSARTDVIVYLPGGRNLIIDSKLSLLAYTDYANAATDDERKAALKLHLASVRGHITGLSKAGYHKLPGVESPDFVVMFVPVEPAFLMALQGDASLWADAYAQGILLVGPTTLLYVIRIVNVLWQQELQARSVRDVMNRGSELYDKFVNFVSDLEAVGKSLRTAELSYANAMRKLSEGRGNLVRQVEMLKQLGIRTSKQIPRNLLDTADEEESGLALAAQAEENGGPE
ncbi:MAG: DNA recombination protein RmuC [Terracidiphilus sp.]|jgi:DNA recombination protein RmuC